MKEKMENFVNWCKEHPQEVLAFGPVVLTGAVELLGFLGKMYSLSQERDLKTMYVYDRANGHNYILKRAPKASEWIEFDARRKAGEASGVILRDMRLIKK